MRCTNYCDTHDRICFAWQEKKLVCHLETIRLVSFGDNIRELISPQLCFCRQTQTRPQEAPTEPSFNKETETQIYSARSTCERACSERARAMLTLFAQKLPFWTTNCPNVKKIGCCTQHTNRPIMQCSAETLHSQCFVFSYTHNSARFFVASCFFLGPKKQATKII